MFGMIFVIPERILVSSGGIFMILMIGGDFCDFGKAFCDFGSDVLGFFVVLGRAVVNLMILCRIQIISGTTSL